MLTILTIHNIKTCEIADECKNVDIKFSAHEAFLEQNRNIGKQNNVKIGEQ